MPAEYSKRVVFVSSTRADFGKIKALILALKRRQRQFEVHVFATGMHLDPKYGFTVLEFAKCGIGNVHRFVNHTPRGTMDEALATTISGLGRFARAVRPDLIVVHGDRPEALAGAIVGSFNNILVAHIEGGELSGTLDGVLRHSISKLCQLHFVANAEAERRLLQLGEAKDAIFCIGSPDIDLMNSPNLPTLEVVKERYKIPFLSYGIVLMHPVTSETANLREDIRELCAAITASKRCWVVLFPNSDQGTDTIVEEYNSELRPLSKVRIFPSLRFECALTLLKHAQMIVGNSSMGIREAPYYGTPTINVGSRQRGRSRNPNIVHVRACRRMILAAVEALADAPRPAPRQEWGRGDSHQQFVKQLLRPAVWATPVQKGFVDLPGRSNKAATADEHCGDSEFPGVRL